MNGGGCLLRPVVAGIRGRRRRRGEHAQPRRSGRRCPRNHGVEQSVGAAVGEVGFGEAEVEQILPVVAEIEVAPCVFPGDGFGAARVAFDDARQLGNDELVGPEPLAREARVLDGDKVQGCPRCARALGRASSARARPSSALSTGAGLGDASRPSRNAPHRRHRPAVLTRRLAMADADAEHDPRREVRSQIRVGGGRRVRMVAPDVEDAGRGNERRCRVEDRTDVRDAG